MRELQVHGWRGRAVDPAWVHRMLLLRAGDTLAENARARLEKVFVTDDPTGKLKAAWNVKEQLRVLLRTGSLEDAELAKKHLEKLVQASKQPETTRLWRTICRWCPSMAWAEHCCWRADCCSCEYSRCRTRNLPYPAMNDGEITTHGDLAVAL